MAAVQEGTRSHRAQTRGGWNVSWARLGCFFSRSWWSWWTCLIPFFICLYLDFYNFPWHNIHVTVLEGGSGGHLLFACVKVSTCCLSGVPPAPHVLLVLDQWFFSAALQDPWFLQSFLTSCLCCLRSPPRPSLHLVSPYRKAFPSSCYFCLRLFWFCSS